MFKKSTFIFLFIVMFMIITFPVMGTEEVVSKLDKVVEVSKAVTKTAIEESPLNILDFVFKGIESLLVLLLGLAYTLISKYIKDKTVASKVDEALENSVLNTYRTYVKGIKAAKDPLSEGGTKLTEAERNKAYNDAILEAKTILKEEGIDLFKVVNEKYMPARIKKIISMFKFMGMDASEQVKKNS